MEIQYLQILLQIVNFGAVLAALTVLLYRPILKILAERSQKIEQAQLQAESTLQESAQLEEMKKKAKRDAEKEAASIIEEAKRTAQQQADQIIAKAEQQAQQKLGKLQEGWQSERTQLEHSMKQQFNDAVMTVTEKVLGKALDKTTHAKLIDQEIKQILKSV